MLSGARLGPGGRRLPKPPKVLPLPGAWVLGTPPHPTPASSGCLDFGEGRHNGGGSGTGTIAYVSISRHVDSPLGPQSSLLEMELAHALGVAREGLKETGHIISSICYSWGAAVIQALKDPHLNFLTNVPHFTPGDRAQRGGVTCPKSHN